MNDLYDHRVWPEIWQTVLKQGGQLHTEIFIKKPAFTNIDPDKPRHIHKQTSPVPLLQVNLSPLQALTMVTSFWEDRC